MSGLSARQRGVLIAAGVTNALIFLDQTAVVVALPSIQREFHSSTVELQWAIGAYLLALAAFIASSGRLADLYGRRRLFVAGVATFGVGSALCAVAPSMLVLIIARVIQGVGAAIAQPLVIANATAIVPPERRGWAIGVVASAGTSFLVIGPVLGGALVDTLGWRSIFVVNLPLVVFAIGLALRFMPVLRVASAPRLDRIGLVLLTVGLAAIVAAVLHMQSSETSLDVGVLALGTAALAAFVVVERHSAHPLLQLALLRTPRLTGSIIALVSIQASVLGVTVYVLLFLRDALGLGATAAGAVLIAAGIWTPTLSRFTGRIADRRGAARPVSIGLIVAALGLAAVAASAPTKQLFLIVPGLMLFGASRPFVFTPASAAAIRSLPAGDRGLASSLIGEARQVGAVFGVAVLGSIAAAFAGSAHIGASSAGLQAALGTAAAISLLAGVIARFTYSPRTSNASQTPRTRSRMAGKRIVITTIVCSGVAVALTAAGTAIAAPAMSRAGHPAILAPGDGSLVSGSTLTVRARAASGFTALVGAHYVTDRFGPPRDGIRTALLHVGNDIQRGPNRLVVSAGVGRRRRYAAVTFTVARRAPGTLHVSNRTGPPSAVAVTLGESPGARFSQLRITLNGRTVPSQDWMIGFRTPSNQWPFARRRFGAIFGADEGARYGVNRLTVTAWNAKGTFDRVATQVRIADRQALAAAGPGRRTWIHRAIVLDGRATRTRGGAPVRYRWSIVSAPSRSRARLTGADTARPRLRPDLPGRYVMQLTAWPVPRDATGHATVAPGAAGEDYTTVEATPPTPPIGVPITTLTSGGGIQVGARTYTVPSDSWAQVLVLDRQTLQVISNWAIGSTDHPLTDSEVNFLTDLVQNQDANDQHPSRLVVVSGGGRPVPNTVFVGPIGSDLQTMVASAGGNLHALTNERTAWQQAVTSGHWSIVGAPGVIDSGTSNLYGLQYGLYAGDPSVPGALTGHLQTDNNNNYTFVSGQYTSIDTQPPNTPQGTARVQIGSHLYTSDPSAIPSGGSGFYLLVLDSALHERQSSTYYTNTGPTANPSGVQALAQALFGVNQTPGQLVVVQSINAPTGSTSDWSNDAALATDSFASNTNAAIPQDDSTWGTSSLVAALGALAGTVAHDQVAHMVTPAYGQPDPSYGGKGYTLIASSGALWDSSAAPISRSQAGSGAPEARVEGLLTRSRQGLWTVHEPSAGLGPDSVALAELAYQPPVPWPLSQTPAEQAVLSYLQRQLNFSYPIRTEYFLDSKLTWSDVATQLQGVSYPTNEPFDAATFAAVKAQLHTEMIDVSLVQGLVSQWNNVFSNQSGSGYADLQSIAQTVTDSINLPSPSSTVGNVLGTTGESLWVLSTVLTLTGNDPEAAGVGLAACLFDLASDIVADTAGGAAGTPDISAAADQLGAAFMARYVAIQSHLGHVEEILVSDWGKLQQAAANTKSIWAVNAATVNDMVAGLSNSAQREFWTALLPIPYVQYVVDPPFVWGETQTPENPIWTFPWQVECQSNSFAGGDTAAFGTSALDDQSSWETTPVRLIHQPPFLTLNDQEWFGLTRYATFEGETITRNPDTVPTSLTQPLFQPGYLGGLGMDKVAFFADPRWQRLWFSCIRAQ